MQNFSFFFLLPLGKYRAKLHKTGNSICFKRKNIVIKVFTGHYFICKSNISIETPLPFRRLLNSLKPFENMGRRNSFSGALVKSIFSAAIFLILGNTVKLYAQNNTDTLHKILLASADVKQQVFYTIQQSNVIFPDILKGNEALASDYIATFSSTRRDYLVRMHTKGKTILPKVNTILKKYELPEELSVLMILESAYNANAVSKAGAVGYWQFMDKVANEYGLKYTRHLSAAERKKIARLNAKKGKKHSKAKARQKDERKNFEKSTLAAARYLRDRGLNLDNNWLLIVASYNCGVGNVWNAMKKTGKENPDFWDVKEYLPNETQTYVMNFIALNVIYHNYDNFISNNLNFTTVKILLPDNFKDANTEEEGATDRTFH